MSVVVEQVLSHNQEITQLGVCVRDKYVYYAVGNLVVLQDICSTHQVVLSSHTAAISGLDLSCDGLFLVSADVECNLFLFDLSGASCLSTADDIALVKKWRLQFVPTHLAFSKKLEKLNQTLLYVGSDQEQIIHVYSWHEGLNEKFLLKSEFDEIITFTRNRLALMFDNNVYMYEQTITKDFKLNLLYIYKPEEEEVIVDCDMMEDYLVLVSQNNLKMIRNNSIVRTVAIDASLVDRPSCLQVNESHAIIGTYSGDIKVYDFMHEKWLITFPFISKLKSVSLSLAAKAKSSDLLPIINLYSASSTENTIICRFIDNSFAILNLNSRNIYSYQPSLPNIKSVNMICYDQSSHQAITIHEDLLCMRDLSEYDPSKTIYSFHAFTQNSSALKFIELSAAFQTVTSVEHWILLTLHNCFVLLRCDTLAVVCSFEAPTVSELVSVSDVAVKRVGLSSRLTALVLLSDSSAHVFTMDTEAETAVRRICIREPSTLTGPCRVHLAPKGNPNDLLLVCQMSTETECFTLFEDQTVQVTSKFSHSPAATSLSLGRAGLLLLLLTPQEAQLVCAEIGPSPQRPRQRLVLPLPPSRFGKVVCGACDRVGNCVVVAVWNEEQQLQVLLFDLELTLLSVESPLAVQLSRAPCLKLVGVSASTCLVLVCQYCVLLAVACSQQKQIQQAVQPPASPSKRFQSVVPDETDISSSSSSSSSSADESGDERATEDPFSRVADDHGDTTAKLDTSDSDSESDGESAKERAVEDTNGDDKETVAYSGQLQAAKLDTSESESDSESDGESAKERTVGATTAKLDTSESESDSESDGESAKERTVGATTAKLDTSESDSESDGESAKERTVGKLHSASGVRSDRAVSVQDSRKRLMTRTKRWKAAVFYSKHYTTLSEAGQLVENLLPYVSFSLNKLFALRDKLHARCDGAGGVTSKDFLLVLKTSIDMTVFSPLLLNRVCSTFGEAGRRNHVDARRFLSSFAIFMKGDLETKLGYCFDCYDIKQEKQLHLADLQSLCLTLLLCVNVSSQTLSDWKIYLVLEIKKYLNRQMQKHQLLQPFVKRSQLSTVLHENNQLFHPLYQLREFSNGLLW